MAHIAEEQRDYSADVREQDASGRRHHRVEGRVRFARDSLPGQRHALPAGALPGPSLEPHGDENRDPPKAPTPPP
jgi:hypothetical protein